MTKDEILSMPATAYMCQAQLDFFRELLSAELAASREAAQHARNAFSEKQIIPDISDWATAEQERHHALRTLERNDMLAKKIMKALDRISNGEYGWCEETGEPIGIQRLLSRPTATLTIEAKQRQEALERHRYKMRGAA